MVLGLLDPDPFVRGMDSRIQIRIQTKLSWISNTGWGRSRRNYSVNRLRHKLSSSVVDPDPLIWLTRIRIWIHLGNADPDPDPAARKLTKINKNPDFQAFQKGFCTYYLDISYDLLRYLSTLGIFFMWKFNCLWRKSLTGIRIRIGLASGIRIRTEVKSRIRIRIETNSDPEHCFSVIFSG